MVKQIIWTKRAQNDRIAIFTYWNNKNRSTHFSKKLNELIKESLIIISNHPNIGKLTDQENVRVKVLRDYLITTNRKKTKSLYCQFGIADRIRMKYFN